MRVSRARLLVAALLAAWFVVAALPCAAQGTAAIVKSGLVEKLPGGEIDWGREWLYATGEGAMPSAQEEPNRARAKLRAADYAKMEAIAHLYMLIEGTSVSYEATGRDYMAQDVSLRQTIEGYCKNVEVLKTETLTVDDAKIVRVTVGTRLYGPSTPGTALLQKMSELALANLEPAPVKVEIPKTPPKPPAPAPVVAPKPAAPKPNAVKPTAVKPAVEKPARPAPVTPAVAPAPPPPAAPKPAPPAPVVEPKPVVVASVPKPAEPVVTAEASASTEGPVYTSVIVDTLGYNVMRAMSPKLRTKDGVEVWGTIKIDPDDVQDQGPVAYTRTMVDAHKSPRAGANPLELKAIGRAGGSRMCDVVLSDEDVAKLKAADSAAKPPFLAQMKVVLVVDPAKAF